MNQQKIIIARNLLITQMNHWIVFTIGITILGLTGSGKPDMLRWILLSLFPFFLFLIRRYTNKFLPFVAWNLLAAAVMLPILYGALIPTIVYLVYLAGYLIISAANRLRTEDRLDRMMSPIASVVVPALMLALMNYQKMEGWDLYYILPLVIFLGIYFLIYYIEHYLHFLIVNESSAGHMPEKEIFRSGLKLVIIYAAAGVLILLATANIGWLAGILRQLKNVLVWFLRLLFSLFGTDSEEITELEEVPLEEQSGGMELPEAGETFWLWQVLEYVFAFALVCALIALVVYGFVKLVKFLKARFGQSLFGEDAIKNDNSKDVREQCEIERSGGNRRNLFSLFLSPEQRVRKLYKKRILEGSNVLKEAGLHKDLNVCTVGECSGRLGIDELAGVYEKVRYSGEECTMSDVKAAKSGMKNVK